MTIYPYVKFMNSWQSTLEMGNTGVKLQNRPVKNRN